MNKISHLTSVHSRKDTRIFIKMCSSLASNNFRVNLVVSDGLGEEVKNGVCIFDVGKVPSGRLSRMLKVTKKIYLKSLELDSDIYHIHDPELIPVGLKLKKHNKKVIFDAHEDLPKQLLNKPYLNLFMRFILSKVFSLYERVVCPKFDAIITATPFIRDKFLKINVRSVDINNFPLLDELENGREWGQKKDEIAYVGGISKIRGIIEVIDAMSFTENIRLNLIGEFNEKNIEKSVKKHCGWSNVNELGFLSRQEIKGVLADSKLGLVTFLPLSNHIEAQPNKMFEYMSAGLPVVSSNFSLWREIIEGNECGICVDPSDSKAISSAIQYIFDHPVEAKRMGENSRRAIENRYNWTIEENKMLKLYRGLLV